MLILDYSHEYCHPETCVHIHDWRVYNTNLNTYVYYGSKKECQNYIKQNE